jgi:RND family efflux transporter MFP subunit
MRAIDGVKATTPVRGKSRRRIFVIGVIVVVVVSSLVGFFLLKPKPPAPAASNEAAERAQLVTATPVAMREFARTAPVSGEVRPVKDVMVYAPTPGVRIAEILVEVADTVEPGAPLARLDADVIDAQVREAEARVREAASEATRASSDWKRVAPAADDPAFSKEEVAKYRAAAESADASLAVARAALAQMKARTKGGYVTAPIGGLVIERNARVGEFADKDALFRIVGDNRLEVAAAVGEGDILSLRQGQRAIFTAGDGLKVEGTLRVAPVSVDPQTRTGQALFDLPADAPVRAGMYLRGEVVVEQSTALAVPTTAVSYSSGVPGVFVIVDGKAHLTPVMLGARSGGYVAVASGLKSGDFVAAAGGAFIMDGDAVRIAAPSETTADASQAE